MLNFRRQGGECNKFSRADWWDLLDDGLGILIICRQ